MMKNKIFNKKRNIIVVIIAVTILIGASIANTVYAVGGWEKVTRLEETVTEAVKNSKIIGSEDTAIKKLWYKSLSSCLENNNFGGWKGHYKTLNSYGPYLIRPEEFRGLDWFTTKGFMNWISEIGDYNTVVSGPYIEYKVTGEYDVGGGDSGNDEIRCGEDDDNLVKRGLPQLGLEAIDVACNPNDDYLTNGIADVDTNETACSAAYNGSNDWHLNEDGKARGRYFKNLVKEKTFGGEVPGGSLDKATDLEMYYIMQKSFNIACIQGSLVFGDNNLGKIVAFNEETGKFEEAGYSVNGENGSDYEVDSPYIGTKTCAQLASDLGKDSKYTKAFLEEQFSDVKSGCKKEFDSEMKKIKDYRDQYRTITDAGASFASVIRRLVNDLGNGKVSTSVAGGQALTPPLANAYIGYIKSKSSEASAKINGSPVYAESIINQLVTVMEEVLSSSAINDDGTVVELGMNDESRAQIDLLLGQMDKKVATCQSNLSTINNFITQNEGGGSGGIGGMYAYDNSGMNIVCSAKNILKQQWDNIKESLELTGAPDIDDDFSSGDYIEIKDDTDTQDSDQKECYDGSGALGWILCPIIYGLSGVGQHMWNEIETNHMQISTTIFSGAGDTSSVKVGWDIMLDIANTIFIILFLVVIFSQLTGVGIDNYGIKKILPKLIVVAILVNLSYIICQIAVDLSNILGVGLNDLMSSGANNVKNESSGIIGSNSHGGMDSGAPSSGSFLTAGATLASIGLVFGWLSSEGGIIATAAWIGLAVLGIVIVVVVAMLFLYLILIAREAGIVMAIVLAPVAIVCYALPNTEKFSKKWFSLFKSLLLVYPICGAMIGAGKFAGAILANSGDGGMKIAAMIVQVVPYFLVPLVLKNSLALMGNVGARLSTLGRNLGRRGSRGATGAIRDSERYKNFQQYNKAQSEARRARRTIDRLGRHRGNLSSRQQNRLAKAQDTYKNWQKGLLENNINTRDAGQFTAGLAQQQIEVEENARDLALYNDANYQIGKREQRDVNRAEDRLKTTAYADADYALGKRIQTASNSDHDIKSTLLYTQPNYVAGKDIQNRLSRENDLGNTTLYTRPGFYDFKRKQFEAQRQNEIRKGYSEQYDKMDKSGRANELKDALSGNGPDAVERLDAAFSSLSDKGDMTEIFEAFSGADFATMNSDLRDRAVALAAGSGDPLLKGWAKSGGTQKLGDYIRDPGASGLREYLNSKAGSHAFDTASKDTLRFLADNSGASAMSDEMLHNIITTSANANQEAAKAACDLIHGRENAVGKIMSADSLTKINGTIAKAFKDKRVDLSGAIAEIRQPNNSQLLAKVSGPVRTELGL